MLTTATKKKIDNARDILVGKIPMPTAQVEQITLALIYKFMSDMDKKAKDLGDADGFFANGYEKYAWEKLMDKALPARDRVLLYREALEKMALNPYIPQLFCDVFRNASLPFNDPETLKLFLDVIDQFEYDHSEELGNAFEYLLQVMGSQGDAGQFRTPRHIIDFIVQVVEPQKTDKILDPACGTAGFLISAYKYLKEKGLSSDEMNQISENFVGYDISQDMQRLSLVNMYLHHLPNPHIYEYDSLTSEDRWNENFDVILANPPFMSPKGGIKPHNHFSVPSKRAEVLFVDYIMEHLNGKGKAGVIVPEGIIFQSQNTYKALRKMMIEENFLWAVVSLPAGVFQPYSGVKTSILLFDREIAKKTDKILFVKVNSDGFDLGAQRRESDKNDLPVARNLLLKFKQAILSGKELSLDDALEMSGGPSDKDMVHSYGFDLNANSNIKLDQIVSKAYDEVTKDSIKESNYDLSVDKYKVSAVGNSEKWATVTLGEICTLLQRGKSPKYGESNFQIIKSGQARGYFTFDFSTKYFVDENFKIDHRKLEKGDLLVNSTGVGTAGRVTLFDLNGDYLADGHITIVRLNKKIANSKFVLYVLANYYGFKTIEKMATGSGGKIELSLDTIRSLKIPLPPISIQEEIIEEIDQFKKIIDGAKQILNSWKPIIKVDSKWEEVRLGDICDVRDGTHESPKKILIGYPLITSKNIKSGKIDFSNVSYISNEDFNKISKRSHVDIGDIIMPMIGTIGGACLIRSKEKEFAIKNVALFKKSEKIIPEFLLNTLNSDVFRKMFENKSSGSTQKFVSLSVLRDLKIKTPSLEVQKEIVGNIQMELLIIEGVKELINNYQQRSKKKIEEVWKK